MANTLQKTTDITSLGEPPQSDNEYFIQHIPKPQNQETFKKNMETSNTFKPQPYQTVTSKHWIFNIYIYILTFFHLLFFGKLLRTCAGIETNWGVTSCGKGSCGTWSLQSSGLSFFSFFFNLFPFFWFQSLQFCFLFLSSRLHSYLSLVSSWLSTSQSLLLRYQLSLFPVHFCISVHLILLFLLSLEQTMYRTHCNTLCCMIFWCFSSGYISVSCLGHLGFNEKLSPGSP